MSKIICIEKGLYHLATLEANFSLLVEGAFKSGSIVLWKPILGIFGISRAFELFKIEPQKLLSFISSP